MRRSDARSPRRVFIGLVEVAGFYGRLAAGFREVGVEVTFADLGSNPFSYPNARPPLLVRCAQWTAQRRERAGASRWRASLARVGHRLMLVVLFVWAAASHDAFIFSYRSTFMWFLDLPILKALGKSIVFVFNGSDARPAYIDGADVAISGVDARQWTALTRRKRTEIARIERWADQIVAHPLYLHLFTRPAAAIQILGLPAPQHDGVSSDHSTTGTSIRIVHAPSDAAVKGSARIRAVVDELREEGLPLEFIELRGVPNAEVQRQLERCDFAIDQLYSDLPMSVFALEAAVHGKAVVVGGYGWDEIAATTPARFTAPVAGCHPDHLRVVVRRLCQDAAYRRGLGDAARRFAESWAAREVALRYHRLLRGDVPAEWLTDPSECRYVHGVGLSEKEARDNVAAVLEDVGIQGLVLDHRPDLQQTFAVFAAGTDRAVTTRARGR